MANPRRIAALDLLHRLKQLELEQTGERLGDIRRQQSEIDTEKRHLQDRAVFEAQVTAPEALPFVADFLVSLDRRRDQLTTRMAELDAQAAATEHALIDAFIDARTQKIVLDQASNIMKQQQASRDEMEAGEVAQSVHRRKTKLDSERF